jgi:predicted nucleic acid-binding Zn ribbon protein
MEPRSLRKIIKKFLASSSLGKNLTAIELLARWDEILSPVISKHARPVGIREDKLLIEVSSSAWLNELSFLKDKLKSKLNEELGKEVIKEIRFYLKEE